MRKLINILSENAISEAFDKASPWNKTSNFQGVEYTFSVEGHDYDASFFPHEMNVTKNVDWGFCFSYVGDSNGATKKPVHSDLGHMGKSASRVFATVGAILISFVKEYSPSLIEFTGDKENGRADFYAILLRHLSARIEAAGYTFKRDNGHFSFVRKDLTETVELDEMPMTAITQVGDWGKNSSFKDQDRKLLNNPKATSKMKAMWNYPEEVDYNVILINNPEAKKHTEVGLIGAADEAKNWLTRQMPKTAPEIIPMLDSAQINIIYTNNSGAERVPMTGWIMAHRFGHAIMRMGKSQYYDEAANTLSRYLGDLAEQYGIPLNGVGYGDRRNNALLSTTTRNLMTQICTFKSARDNNLRNTFEAMHELFAQYIITGKLTFNPVPRMAKVGNSKYFYRGSEREYQDDCHVIQHDLSYELEQFFETAIHYAVGRTFVM